MMKKSNKNLAIGTFLAAAAGYIAGILTAPKKGSETRKDIVDLGIKTEVEAEKSFKKILADLNKVIKDAEVMVSKKGAEAKKELNQALETAKSAKEKVRNILSSLHEGTVNDKELKNALDDSTKALVHLRKFIENTVETVKKK